MKTILWMFLIMPLIFASKDVLYLKRLEGESALFVCASEETGSHPIGLYLKRQNTGPTRDVMFFSESGLMGKPEDKERIQVLGDLSTIPVNVTVSQLQQRDSGSYYCEFVYARKVADSIIRGKEEFFLFVETMKVQEEVRKGLQCSCPNYPPLLYAISAAVGLLLLILLGLAVSHCSPCKPCKCSKPQTQVPLYEEMIGGQPANSTGPCHYLDPSRPEEADAILYSKLQLKHRQEIDNPQEIQPASGASATAMEESQ